MPAVSLWQCRDMTWRHVMWRHVMWRHIMTSCHVMSCHVTSCHVMSCHVVSVKRPSKPIRTVDQAFWMLWRHHYDVTVSREIIGDVTNRLSMATFLQAPNRKESAISNSFRDIWPEIVRLHDVIADVVTPGSTLHVYARCSRWLC